MKIIPIKSIVLMFLLLFVVRAVLNNSKGIISFFSNLTNSSGSKSGRGSKPVFKVNDLSDDDKKRLTDVGAYNSKCPVPLEDLKILTVSFKNFENKNNVGNVIVHKKVADTVLEVFKTLFEVEFPLASVRPIYDFDGSDDKSMLANNTTAFHCRPVTYSQTVMSKHSYGTAIDFNPIQNPYLRRGVVLPVEGKAYLDRKILRFGMVESIVDLMSKFGFKEWAGSWDSPIDYMHFEFVEE